MAIGWYFRLMMSRCSSSMPRVARGYPLPGASVPRPDGHGTGGVSAPVRRRCNYAIHSPFKERPSSRFRGISLPSHDFRRHPVEQTVCIMRPPRSCPPCSRALSPALLHFAHRFQRAVCKLRVARSHRVARAARMVEMRATFSLALASILCAIPEVCRSDFLWPRPAKADAPYGACGARRLMPCCAIPIGSGCHSRCFSGPVPPKTANFSASAVMEFLSKSMERTSPMFTDARQ